MDMTPKRRPTTPKVVAITPVHNEAESLFAFQQAIIPLFESADFEFHVLFVDDGSSDESWQIIEAMASENNRIEGIRLSRNYGSHIAYSAGFRHVDADVVITLACDLQDPPNTLFAFLEKWRAGADIVWGYRRERSDGFFRVAASNLSRSFLKKWAMPKNSKFTTGSFFLADRKVVNCVKIYREHHPVTFALVAWTGFDQDIVYYDRGPRKFGKSRWTRFMLGKTFYDVFFGFSLIPVKFVTTVGLAVFLISFLWSVFLVIWWALGSPLPGWTSTILVTTTLFGVQFLLMGLIGEYLYRIYSEVTDRPLFFISNSTYDRE